MTVFKRVDLTQEDRAERLSRELVEHLETLHNTDYVDDIEVEQLLLDQQQDVINKMKENTPRPHIYVFTPSGASKCCRELYYRLKKETPKEERFTYHRRWVRNATAVHMAIQRDMLYAEKIVKLPRFKVARKNGLPAWEENLKDYVIINHNGQEFAVLGMMDGILDYKDGSKIGFEFKTKSTTIAAVGNYLMKRPADSHTTQAVAYSILFGVDEYLFLYESLAKDGWTKGAEAKPDIRVFYHKVTPEDREQLLNKFAAVVAAVKVNELPPKQEDKCLFCQYKHICNKEAE